MRLTKEEKEVCKAYSKRDENNTVHCFECPLVISTRECLCKANCTREEWSETREEPEINPCRGCEDYDGEGGCLSNGGCGAKMDEVEENEE